ncbi:MAG: imidazoleglycerol-phosphate dehydratase HisB [Acidimicrobiales bacterium]
MADPARSGERSGNPRRAARSRATKETAIEVSLELVSKSTSSVDTGLPFFDHMLEQLAKHGDLGLEIRARGDLQVDAHHTVEDVGILIGETLREALGDKAGIRRFASVSLPLDEALVDVALDLSGRPYLRYDISFGRESTPLGSPPFEPQLAEEFWRGLVHAAGITLHLSSRYGRNPHHLLEASSKAVAVALKEAARIDGQGIPSTKGLL